MLAAGVGSFLAPTQKSRTFTLEMEPYSEETKPERKYYAEEDTSDLDAVYTYPPALAARVKLDPKLSMPQGILRRSADNVRGLLSIADSCGAEWGQRAREAVTLLFEKERAELPQLTMVRHGLVIFEALEEVDQIGSIRFNRELKRLDLPDARWTSFEVRRRRPRASARAARAVCASGEVDIHAKRVRPPGEKQCRGYKRAWFEEAARKYGVTAPDEAEVGRARLRLVKPLSD